MQLPLNLPLLQTQSQWAAILNPVLANALLNGNQLTGIALKAGIPQTINHGLSQNQNGYIITDQNAQAMIYRTQPFNNKTLTLQSSAAVTINLWVY